MLLLPDFFCKEKLEKSSNPRGHRYKGILMPAASSSSRLENRDSSLALGMLPLRPSRSPFFRHFVSFHFISSRLFLYLCASSIHPSQISSLPYSSLLFLPPLFSILSSHLSSHLSPSNPSSRINLIISVSPAPSATPGTDPHYSQTKQR